LLQLSLPLVKTYGFSREALARSVLCLGTSSTSTERTHAEPLSDTAVTALFGSGDEARRRLFDRWLEEGLMHMENRARPSVNGRASVRDALHARLEYNESVIGHLPEAFALLISPASGVPPLDPFPALKHIAHVAKRACHVSGEKTLQLDWYTRRGSLACIYAAAELHQLTSPQTAYSFLIPSLMVGRM